MKNDFRKYIAWIVVTGILIGFVSIIAGAFFLETDKSWRIIASLTLIEFGAVIIATSLIHVIHEKTTLDELAALKDLSLRGLCKYHHTLTNDELRKRLAKSRSITVLKTWFPENAALIKGLRRSLEKGSDNIELILLNPNSDLIRKRSMAATTPEDESVGPNHVIHAIRLMYQWMFIENISTKGKIRIYDYWPGSPLIKLDDCILLGFYWIGKSSPDCPWLEIRMNSELYEELNSQIELMQQNGQSRSFQGELLQTQDDFDQFALRNNFTLP